MFRYGTLVSTAGHGKEEIQLMGKAMALSGMGGVTNLLEEKEVHSVSSTDLYRVNRIVVGGTVLFMTADGWAAVDPGRAKEQYPDFDIIPLTLGHTLITEGGEEEVTTLRPLSSSPDKELCCEISLDGNNTFYANGYLVHNKGGSSAPSTTTTVQKSEPPKYLQPYLTDIAQKAQQAYGQVPQGGFSGNLVADVDPLQRESLALQENVARGLEGFGDSTAAIAQQQTDRILSGDILAPINERFDPRSADTAGVIQAALDPLRQELTEQIIPGIQSQAIQQGAYGGTRQDVVTENALRDFSREAGNIAAGINYQDFARTEDQRFNDLLSIREFGPELEKINQAAILTAPEIQNQAVQQSLLPSTILNQVGSTERLFEQDLLDEAYNEYLLSLQTPFAGLGDYAGIVSGIPSGQITTGTANAIQPRGGSTFGNVLSGGLGGLGIASALSLSNPLTAGLGIGGAILGGLLG